MISPNLYTHTEQADTYGLHRFRDGAVYLVQLYKSGDWFTLRPARTDEVKFFEKYGVKTGKGI